MDEFTETSSEPYDRHHYRVWFQDGSFEDVECYEQARVLWYRNNPRPKCIDVKERSRIKKAKGFRDEA